MLTSLKNGLYKRTTADAGEANDDQDSQQHRNSQHEPYLPLPGVENNIIRNS